MIIPGFLISLLTFPGVIAHEMAHLFFCRLCRVHVFKVCYFRFGNPAGYVEHAQPDSALVHMLIGIGPFIFNTLLAIAVALPTVWPGVARGLSPFWHYGLLWLGISIAAHAFPSTGDARAIWHGAWRRGVPWYLKLLSIPLVGTLYLFALGSIFWLDVIYGVAVAVILPPLLVHWLGV
ncbi:MAG: DUF3267 domain-containing protein [Armatimonadota bacterium]